MAAPTTQQPQFVRALVTPDIAGAPKLAPSIVWTPAGLPRIAQHLFDLMLRNVASDGFQFDDPLKHGSLSLPGCILAAPSFPANTPGINQDYVYNWTRDAAVAALEIAAAKMSTTPGTGVEPLIDYVNFAQISQNNAEEQHIFSRASFTIEGQPREHWSDQSDGPALQTLALLKAFDQLDASSQATAKAVINKNLNFLLGAFRNPTTNLWEEHQGQSFFARSVQLKCFQAIKANNIGIAVPHGADEAIAFLQSALGQHFNGSIYISLLPAPHGYDANIDIILASIYGAVPCTDTKLLSTAAVVRKQWSDANSPDHYPINIIDNGRGIGPMMGRYPADTYDGDTDNPSSGDHPWALCTCNFAELYYTLGRHIGSSHVVPFDNLSAPFFSQIGVTSATPAAAVVSALQDAGDSMLAAVIFHSDHLELSEQFDGFKGFEKSVKNLTWSYAAFLSAVRARNGQKVQG